MRIRIDRRHRRQPSHSQRWKKLVIAALPDCKAAAQGDAPPLLELEEVDFVLVSDNTITQVHADFLSDPTPTDVITFHHGEIVISLDTAARQAQENGEPYDREVARYMIHGLLHLAGWNDYEEMERAAMHEVQERILAKWWMKTEG